MAEDCAYYCPSIENGGEAMAAWDIDSPYAYTRLYQSDAAYYRAAWETSEHCQGPNVEVLLVQKRFAGLRRVLGMRYTKEVVTYTCPLADEIRTRAYDTQT